MLVAAGAMVVMLVLVASAGGDPEQALQYRHRHRIHWPQPPPPPSHPRSPPPPPPPYHCNGPVVPEGTVLLSTDCVPAPPPPAPAAPHTCPVCRCPKPAGPWTPTVPGRGAGEWCVAPLAALTPCAGFVTGTEEAAPTPSSACCSGLRAFLSRAAAAAPGDHILGCLCPIILGDVNRSLPRPVDLLRLMFVPVACGVPPPPQLLHLCFAGQSVAP